MAMFDHPEAPPEVSNKELSPLLSKLYPAPVDERRYVVMVLWEDVNPAVIMYDSQDRIILRRNHVRENMQECMSCGRFFKAGRRACDACVLCRAIIRKAQQESVV